MDDFRKQDFPLSDALQELLQQGAARARQLGDAQRELDTLQTCLLKLEQSRESAGSQLRLQENKFSALLCDTERLQSGALRLEAQIHSVLQETLELRSRTEDQQELRRSQQAEVSSYRSRVKESRENLQRELRQKQQEVSGLRLALEELRNRLQKPVRQTQKDIDALKASIHETRQALMERRADLENERQTQTELRREIEIQERRCEAVLKRLRSQLKKAQAGQQQLRSDVTHLQTQLDALRTRLDPDAPL
ncbi:coiled-coil domain-containing protein 122 isoform X2 [Puntigrus tetrazona]|uniref:coiled-coil domain-containing protein 122 isoform X2 n=1 Tax=Puntigrus tetrazona TaxID=1606681 RepID=UPI001C88EA7A|nr:coiled-coil domain-containing protein 122 isoform X2 [Puntigrus tetrazona]